jgi:uncharacterized glyoxalase superfamily protein PhnB
MPFFLNEPKKAKISKKPATAPSKQSVDDASDEGFELGRSWNAYSKEARIHVYVKNMREMIRFYNKILEFPVVRYWRYAEGDGTIINLGGNSLELFSKGRRNYYHKDFSGCASFSVRVKDVHKLHDKFCKKNIVIEDLVKNEWGDTSFSLRDPEGNRICFFSIDVSKEKYYKVKKS